MVQDFNKKNNARQCRKYKEYWESYASMLNKHKRLESYTIKLVAIVEESKSKEVWHKLNIFTTARGQYSVIKVRMQH